jgi:hypothetical protein
MRSSTRLWLPLLLALSPGALAAVPLWQDPAARHLAFPGAPVAVSGLAWYGEEAPVLRRLPSRLRETFPPKVWALAQAPSGGRLRFVTDSATVGILAQGALPGPSPNTPVVADSGLDLYVDGGFFGSTAPDAHGAIRWQWLISRKRKRREITLYLPVGKPIAVREILLEAGSTVAAPRPFALAKPVVYYGSSITQGFAASNAGMTFEAQLSRWLDVDFVNLGFSGNGLGEPALARAVAEIDAACFVVDYWANPSAALYQRTLPGFLAILREKHPLTPIIITGPYYNPSEEAPGGEGERQLAKRAITREFVAERRRAGDSHLIYVDGLEMISRAQAEGLVDGRHANTLGFYYCARGLEPYLRRALGLPARAQPSPGEKSSCGRAHRKAIWQFYGTPVAARETRDR